MFYSPLSKQSKLSPDCFSEVSKSKVMSFISDISQLMHVWSFTVYRDVLLTGSHLILTIMCFKDKPQLACSITQSIAGTQQVF